jgi:hypothetical protein
MNTKDLAKWYSHLTPGESLRAEDSLGTLEKARALGALAAVARKAIESGKVATRIELFDAVLHGRKGKRAP